MVVDDEVVDEGASVARDHGDVPRRGDQDRRSRGERDLHESYASPAAGEREIRHDDHSEQEWTGEPLREHRGSGRRSRRGGPCQPLARRARDVDAVDAAERNRHRRRERHVEAGATREGEPQRGSGERGGRSHGEARAFGAPSDGIDRRDPGERQRGSAETRRELRDADDGVRRGHRPVRERRLLEPGVSCEMRGDPVARDEHFASDLGVAWLVLSEERHAAEPVEEADEGKAYEARQREPLGPFNCPKALV
jgi:hypothetical protein